MPNLNDYTFATFKTLVNVGLDYTTAVGFLMQPGITEIVKAYNTKKSIFTNVTGNPIHAAIRSVAKKLGVDSSDNVGITQVLASLNNIPLKAISSLNSYASMGKKSVILDAKAKWVYLGIYNNNVKVIDECVVEIQTLKEMLKDYPDYGVVLDSHLIDLESEEIRNLKKKYSLQNTNILWNYYSNKLQETYHNAISRLSIN